MLGKFDIVLQNTTNTNTIDEDVKAFGDTSAPHLENTGVLQDGGITNLYEAETVYSETGQYIVTDDNKVISLVDSTTTDYKVVKVDGKPIGQTSSYGVESRLTVEGVEDVFLTTTSYVTCSIVDNVITVTEYDYTGAQLNTRTLTFTNLSAAMKLYTSLSFVRYNGMVYADSLEFALRLGEQVIILQESNLGITIPSAFQSTNALGTANINATVVYNGTLVVAGDSGRVASYDGAAWKYYDGSGTGSGVYNSGDGTLGVVGSNNILSLCVYTYGTTTYLVVGGASGRIGSYNGTSWNKWDSGVAISNNATVVSTDNVTCMLQAGEYLIVAGSVGKLGSWRGSTAAWILYSAGSGVCDNATLIGAVSINAMTWYVDAEGLYTLVVAGASGRVGSMKINGGTNWTFTTNPAPAAPGWVSITYGNGLFVAIADSVSTSASIATSPDGITWTFRTTPQPQFNWVDVAYGAGKFVAIARTDSVDKAIAYSTDGITWQFTTTPSHDTYDWNAITYGNGLFVAVVQTGVANQGICTSSDGITWVFQTTPVGVGGWVDVTYGNGLFVAVAFTTSTTKGIATSPDGITWTFQTTTAPAAGWYRVEYGYKLFVALALTTSTTAGVATSSDGITWTFRTTTAPGGNWCGLSYWNGLFVACASTTSTTAGIATSSDGITWTFRTTTAPGGGWRASVFGANKFVMVSATTSTTAGIAYSLLDTPIKKVYTATSSVLYPTNNGTVIGANAINAMVQYNTYLVCAGAAGLVGSFKNDNTWYAYNSGGLYTDNATLIGANAIQALCVIGSTLALGGVGGRLASMNLAGTKTLYTAGSGLCSNATIIGANDINAMTVYSGKLMVVGDASTVNNTTESGVYTTFYADGGTVVANLLSGFDSLGYLYVYRYENGLYLVNLVGNTLNKSYTLNNTTKAISTITCKYAIPQVSGGYTRHIVTASNTTARPLYDASNIKAAGLVGYTDFSTYSGTVVYPSAPYVVTGILSSQAGFGYDDFTFQVSGSATNIYSYTPQYTAPVSGLYVVTQGNTNTLCNAYGKLTNNLGVTPSKPFEFRVGWINGVQSYLSVALLDGIASDAMGTIITNIGEFDDVYQPMVISDDRILYRYNNIFQITKIGKTIADRIQRVAYNVYKVNSISPLNIVDPKNGTITVGSSDYNNRMRFISSAAPGSSVKFASLMSAPYSSSIDTGDKLVTITSPTSSNVELLGYRIPTVSTSIRDYAIDVYFNDIYSFSTMNDGSELVFPNKVDTLYVGNAALPVPLGVEYSSGTAKILDKTLFLADLYDGFNLGNAIDGSYDAFSLYGQLYLFDGNYIYLATMESGALTATTIIANAAGLRFIAITPTEAVFLSDFDNALYSFNGGRTLAKTLYLNRLDPVLQGAWSVRDNALILETATRLVWVRDGRVTINLKDAAQTAIALYPTTDGLVIGNNTANWLYSYKAVGTVVPLLWQSAYFGADGNTLSYISNAVIVLHSPTKQQLTGTLSLKTFDENRYYTETKTLNITPDQYNTVGYARVRIQPGVMRGLGASIGVNVNEKCIIAQATIEFVEDTTAGIAEERTV